MSYRAWLVGVSILAIGCGSDADSPDGGLIVDRDVAVDSDSATEVDMPQASDAGRVDVALSDLGHNNGADAGSWVPACDAAPCPIVIESFPYTDTRTTIGGASQIDVYSACAPQDESGPEVAYIFRLQEAGTVVAGVRSATGADIDIHLLDALQGEACVRRGDVGISADLLPGIYYLVADSFVTSAGVVGDGGYDLRVDFYPATSPCAMNAAQIPRIGTDDLLPMPATGRIVKEAHLMTEEEHQSNLASAMTEFPSGWPTAFTDRIAEHYSVTEVASGYEMDRAEPWAPCCEPMNEFGQGSSVRPPADAEPWYINMRWRTAPGRGERYILVNPMTGQAVVAAAGYENGPGDLTRVGGASEEIHDVMGTTHLGTMTFGQAADQTLSYGPIDCY